MDKKTILALALCGAILALWMVLFPAPKPAAPPAGAPVATAPAGPSTAAGGPPAPGGEAPVPAGSAAGNRPERQVEIQTPHVRFVFSSHGGTLLHAQLKDSKFLERAGDPTSGRDIVRTLEAKDAPLRTTFPDSGFPTPADGAWEVSQPSPETVVFATDADGVHIEKRYRAEADRYRLQLDVVVANRSDRPIDHHLALTVTGRQDPSKRGGGFMSGPASNPS